jgi:rhamnosyltransferase
MPVRKSSGPHVMLASQANNQCCAVLVSFNPEKQVLLALVAKISKQCRFILIDNASENASTFMREAGAYENCIATIALDSNIGLAAAMNIGLTRAVEEKAKYAILFDQDSAIRDRFVPSLLEALNEAQGLSPKPVAAVGPRISNPTTGRGASFKIFSAMFHRTNRVYPRSNGLFEADMLISSGCLIVLDTLGSIGLMKESYFIDNIDLEWCFRAKYKGFELVGCDHAVLFHSIGEASDSALVKAGLMVHHSPLRSFYSTRNRFHLYTLPHAPMGWKVRDFPRFLLKSLWLIFSSHQRTNYWKNIKKGLREFKELE